LRCEGKSEQGYGSAGPRTKPHIGERREPARIRVACANRAISENPASSCWDSDHMDIPIKGQCKFFCLNHQGTGDEVPSPAESSVSRSPLHPLHPPYPAVHTSTKLRTSQRVGKLRQKSEVGTNSLGRLESSQRRWCRVVVSRCYPPTNATK